MYKKVKEDRVYRHNIDYNILSDIVILKDDRDADIINDMLNHTQLSIYLDKQDDNKYILTSRGIQTIQSNTNYSPFKTKLKFDDEGLYKMLMFLYPELDNSEEELNVDDIFYKWQSKNLEYSSNELLYLLGVMIEKRISYNVQSKLKIVISDDNDYGKKSILSSLFIFTMDGKGVKRKVIKYKNKKKDHKYYNQLIL